MSMKSIYTIIIGLFFALGNTTQAEANLYDRGGGLVYDSDLNITWLKDANYAKTSGFSSTGGFPDSGNFSAGWYAAEDWVHSLNYYDSVTGVTWSGWRLAVTSADACTGYNCTGGELGHLFYSELGGVAGTSLSSQHNANYSLLSNIQEGHPYWGENYQSTFSFANGNQTGIATGGGMADWASIYAWPVHTGDIGVVPVPAAIWLFGSAIAALLSLGRRKSDR